MTATSTTWTEPTLIVDNDGNPTAPQHEDSTQTAAPDDRGAPPMPAAKSRFRLWRYVWMIVLIAILGTTLSWLATNKRLSFSLWNPASSSSQDAMLTTRAASSTPANVPEQTVLSAPQTAVSPTPATAPKTPESTATTPPSFGIPMDIINGYASVKVLESRLSDVLARLDHLAEQVQGLSVGDARREAQLTQLRTALNARPKITTAKPIHPASHTNAKRLALAQTNLPTPPTASHEGNLTLLAVDTWNGTPSVAISRGGVIHFLSPGDATADGVLLKSADPTAQQAIFGLPGGQTSTLHTQP